MGATVTRHVGWVLSSTQPKRRSSCTASQSCASFRSTARTASLAACQAMTLALALVPRLATSSPRSAYVTEAPSLPGSHGMISSAASAAAAAAVVAASATAAVAAAAVVATAALAALATAAALAAAAVAAVAAVSAAVAAAVAAAEAAAAAAPGGGGGGGRGGGRGGDAALRDVVAALQMMRYGCFLYFHASVGRPMTFKRSSGTRASAALSVSSLEKGSSSMAVPTKPKVTRPGRGLPRRAASVMRFSASVAAFRKTRRAAAQRASSAESAPF